MIITIITFIIRYLLTLLVILIASILAFSLIFYNELIIENSNGNINIIGNMVKACMMRAHKIFYGDKPTTATRVL